MARNCGTCIQTGDEELKESIQEHCHSSRMHTEDLSLGMLETTTESPKINSPTGDESLSTQPLLIVPDLLIFEVLRRLSVKSLMRFKCICKSWNTLICDPKFAKEHLRTSREDPNKIDQRLVSCIHDDPCKIVSCSMQSLFQNWSTPPETVDIWRKGEYEIMGSCNGLLCLLHIRENSVLLWNPSTRFKSERFPIGCCLNDKVIDHHGFGYDQVDDKYKALLVINDHDKIVTKIYTFGANSWTELQRFGCWPTTKLGKFFNGVLHWIARKGVNDDQLVIFCLDMGKETYGEILLPDRDGGHISCYVTEVMRNRLCACFFYSKQGYWAVWLMKDYGIPESWTKLMVIPQGEPRVNIWPYAYTPLCISKNGIVMLKIDKASWIGPFTNLLLYNLNDGSISYPEISDELGFVLHVYHESLISQY